MGDVTLELGSAQVLQATAVAERPKRTHKAPSRFEDTEVKTFVIEPPAESNAAAGTSGKSQRRKGAKDDHTNSTKTLAPGIRLTKDHCTPKLMGKEIVVYWPDDRRWYLAEVLACSAWRIADVLVLWKSSNHRWWAECRSRS